MDTHTAERLASKLCRFRCDTDIGIIETHQHISEPGKEDRTFGWGSNDIDTILTMMDAFGVEASILQPLGGAHDPIAVHDLIHEYSQQHEGRIFGIGSLNIKEYGIEKTAAELERCVRDLGFVGIKFHGFSHGINPMSRLAQVYFDAARDLEVPIMVCVGAHGMPFTNPGLFIERAAEYPDLKIVFAHMDYTIAETLIANAARMDNLYLSSSLSISAYLELAVSRAGAGKVMLASEDAASIPSEIAKALFSTHDDEALAEVLRRTPIRVFQLHDRLKSGV